MNNVKIMVLKNFFKKCLQKQNVFKINCLKTQIYVTHYSLRIKYSITCRINIAQIKSLFAFKNINKNMHLLKKSRKRWKLRDIEKKYENLTAKINIFLNVQLKNELLFY